MGNGVAKVDPEVDVLAEAPVLLVRERIADQHVGVLGLLDSADNARRTVGVELAPLGAALLEESDRKAVPGGHEQK